MKHTICWLLLLICCCSLPAPAQTTPAETTEEEAEQEKIPEGFTESEYDRLKRQPSVLDRIQQALDQEAVLDLEEEEKRGGLEGLEGLQAIIRSVDSLAFDPQTNFIYSRSRTEVQYGDYTLKSDRLVLDPRLLEVQAEGNVVLGFENTEFEADRMFFNFKQLRGLAYDVEGNHQFLYIEAGPEEEEGDPTFRQMSQNESLFEEANFTSCDFPVPHYYVKAKEAMLYPNERLFIRNAVVYVAEVPVAYVPFFTRSLKENQPWHFVFGHGSRLGTFVLGTYQYRYGTYEPDWQDESEMVARSEGDMKYHFDYFSKRGFGFGLDHGYSIDYGRHKGKWELYGINDRERDVEGDDSDFRWAGRVGHRSKLAPRWWWHLNVDYMSDPEIYFDIIDRKGRRYDRDRLPERRARTSLMYLRDNILARVLFDIKERVSRDRVTNFSEPGDDDRDFDTNSELVEDNLGIDLDDEDEGIPSDRYGRVSERLPQVTVATNWLNMFGSNFYYNFDINAINNLDKGLNVNSDEDDAFARGVDLYNQIMFYFPFTSDTNLITKFGLGGGYIKREEDEYDLDFPPGTTFPGDPFNNNLTFLDEETFVVGDEERSLADVDPGFVYADSDIELNHRFTRALRGYVRHFFREGTDDNLSEFYETIGSRLTRSDFYNFRIKEHFVEAGLNYQLQYPDFNAFLRVRENLQSESDIFANERLRWAGIGWTYRTPRQVLELRNNLAYSTIQVRDPSDEFAFERDDVWAGAGVGYYPLHNNWWTDFDVFWRKTLDDDPADREADEFRLDDEDNDRDFDETDPRLGVRGAFATRIGPKWVFEMASRLETRENDFQEFIFILKRDLHDMILNFELELEQEFFGDDDDFDDDDDDDDELEFTFRVFVTFKLPDEDILQKTEFDSLLRTRRGTEEES